MKKKKHIIFNYRGREAHCETKREGETERTRKHVSDRNGAVRFKMSEAGELLQFIILL